MKRRPTGGSRLEFDEDVDIALGTGFAPGRRAKDPDLLDAEPLLHFRDGLSELLEEAMAFLRLSCPGRPLLNPGIDLGTAKFQETADLPRRQTKPFNPFVDGPAPDSEMGRDIIYRQPGLVHHSTSPNVY